MFSAFLPGVSSKLWSLFHQEQTQQKHTEDGRCLGGSHGRMPLLHGPQADHSGRHSACFAVYGQATHCQTHLLLSSVYQLASFTQGPAAGERRSIPSRPVIHQLPKEKVYACSGTRARARARARTHTHTHTSPIPNQEKGSDWPVSGQITSLNPNKHNMELGSRHPTGLQAPLHPAGEGTGCPCDLVRYYSESIIHGP